MLMICLKSWEYEIQNHSYQSLEKDVKRCKKRNLPMEKLKKVIRLLEETGKLPPEYKPHKLSGQYAGSWECHIMPDWLLIWKQYNDELVLVMTNTGSHSDVF